jgi:hypothetical protein
MPLGNGGFRVLLFIHFYIIPSVLNAIHIPRTYIVLAIYSAVKYIITQRRITKIFLRILKLTYFKPCDFSTHYCSVLNWNYSSEFTINYVVNIMSAFTPS